MNAEGKSEPEIIVYPDMSQIDEKSLSELAAKEREWYGYESYGEYAICSDPDCRRLMSIDEVYGVADTDDRYVPLPELEKDGPKLPDCPDCGGKTELVFDHEILIEYLRLQFAQKIYGALLMNNNEIQGAASVFKGKFGEVFDIINYRRGFDIEKFLNEISQHINKTISDVPSQNVVCLNRLAISRPFRGKNNFSRLVKGVLDSHREYDELPVVYVTRYDSPAYALHRAFGDEAVSEDPYGSVIMFSEKYGNLRNALSLSPKEFKEKYGEVLAEARTWQEEYIQKKKPFLSKNIKGAPLLPEILEAVNSESMQNDDPSIFESLQGKQIRIETLSSAEITDELVKEMSDFYRYIFCNAFGQYLVYPSVGKPISPQEVFNIDEKMYIPLEQLDSFPVDDYPVHPETGEKAIFWHDPEKTFKNFREKSINDGHLTLLRDCETNEIAGIMFGHKCTVKEAFETEEWENPYYYSVTEDKKYYRDFKIFIDKINEVLRSSQNEEIYPESEIYSWNCIATRQDVRGLENLLRLTKSFFNSIPEEMKEKLLIIGEAKFKSRAHALFKTAGAIEVPGILTYTDKLKKDDPCIVIGPLAPAAEIFSLSPEEFESHMKKVLNKTRK